MSTATENGLETAQRVRQFFVQQHLDPFIPSQDLGAGHEAGEDAGRDSTQSSDLDHDEGDLPAFLRNRSLRRRLDDAFEACHQSTVPGWLRAFFRRGA